MLEFDLIYNKKELYILYIDRVILKYFFFFNSTNHLCCVTKNTLHMLMDKQQSNDPLSFYCYMNKKRVYNRGVTELM